jgi:hypothetical protein
MYLRSQKFYWQTIVARDVPVSLRWKIRQVPYTNHKLVLIRLQLHKEVSVATICTRRGPVRIEATKLSVWSSGKEFDSSGNELQYTRLQLKSLVQYKCVRTFAYTWEHFHMLGHVLVFRELETRIFSYGFLVWGCWKSIVLWKKVRRIK